MKHNAAMPKMAIYRGRYQDILSSQSHLFHLLQAKSIKFVFVQTDTPKHKHIHTRTTSKPHFHKCQQTNLSWATNSYTHIGNAIARRFFLIKRPYGHQLWIFFSGYFQRDADTTLLGEVSLHGLPVYASGIDLQANSIGYAYHGGIVFP